MAALLKARKYIYVDPDIITFCLDFISSKQNDDGSFTEKGNVIHKDMQEGLSGKVALTAFVAILYAENIEEFPHLQEPLNLALEYIKNSIDLDDVYALAISCYPFTLENTPILKWFMMPSWIKEMKLLLK